MYDLVVIGGGINGTAIACDAAGRGLSVLLCEKDDLASHTSSSSTKLIHGGLRYLEHYEFALVKEALTEREILLYKAPHIIRPLEFVMPYSKKFRPYWLIRMGLFIYDHLAKRKKLRSSIGVNLTKHIAGSVLQKQFKKGFIYSDCWVDDARLVVLTAVAAKEKGAEILTQTQCTHTKRQKEYWDITLTNTMTKETKSVQAKVLINASGPWVDDVTTNIANTSTEQHVVLVKGSHVVIPKIHAENYAYILQNTDQRVMFVIPFLDHYSLIGTTDIKYSGDKEKVMITADEIQYLCSSVNDYFNKDISSKDIIWSYSGVRPLKYENEKSATDISREYELILENTRDYAPILNVYGGKITTHRRLAEHAMELLKPIFPEMGPNWTSAQTLPGGDIENANFEKFLTEFKNFFSDLPPDLLLRLARQYGTRCYTILHDVKSVDDLGINFKNTLFEREIRYLIDVEFAKNCDDILWRRTKLGLDFSDAEIENLKNYFEKN